MREKQSIILLLYLFQVCKGVIIREKLFNQKLNNSQDVRIDMFFLYSKYKSIIQIPSELLT